ncbi:MAG: D-tyrosyl-tRNA(Tyr) deacylase [Geoglossum umbratile]|nr:MAG: D-tyrosyl-tRNA(Tyr) deacylase [Geoglossum umbratile]
MKAILQRVLSASVTVDQQPISSIGKGVLVFAAIAAGDTQREADILASKVVKTKMWDGEDGARWKQSVRDINGEVLCSTLAPHINHIVVFPNKKFPTVSQFTLLASTSKGFKPDFHRAMAGDQAKELYDYFVSKVQEGYEPEKVKNGVFQAMMKVGLVNDGPVGESTLCSLKTPDQRPFLLSRLPPCD